MNLKRLTGAVVGGLSIGMGLVVGMSLPAGAAPSNLEGPSRSALYATPSESQTRAISSFQALQSNLYLPDYQLYRSTPYDPAQPFGYLWPFTNAMAGTDFLVGSPDGASYVGELAARLQGLLRYGTGSPPQPPFRSAVTLLSGGGTQSSGDMYYDDNAWAALNLIRQYRLTRDHTYVDSAATTFNTLASGWSNDPTRPCPGGVYWVDNTNNRDRNTASTASSAEAAAELYDLTGNTFYLDWATRMYDWVNTCLRSPDNLYYDKIRGDGSIDTTTWSYNQGTMIGTGVLLSETTGDSAYLAEAKATADQAVSYFGTGSTLQSQGPAFNGIYFRNLLLLGSVSPDVGYTDEAGSYGEYMWSSQRDPASGLFLPSSSAVNATGSMVEIYALLAGSPPEGRPVSLVSLASSANPATTGQPVTYTASVSPDPAGGSVAFFDGASVIAGCSAVPITAGAARCTQSYPATGTHSIHATFSGTDDFVASTSPPLVETVGVLPPGSPVLSAVATSPTSVTLTWTQPATGGRPDTYRVDRQTSGGTWSTIADLPAPASSYTDSAVTPSTSYGYRVVAVNGGGSTPSNVVTLTTPGVQITLSAVVQRHRGSVQIRLSWSGGQAPFTVWRADITSGPIVTTRKSSWTDTTVTAGRSYAYQVCGPASTCSSWLTVNT